MLSLQRLDLHQCIHGDKLMATTAQSGRRAVRVLNILKSINESIGSSGALTFIGEDETRFVPRGLRRSIARTAIFMLDEARRRKKKKVEPIKGKIGSLTRGGKPLSDYDDEDKRAARRAKKDASNKKARDAARDRAFKKKHGRSPSGDEQSMLGKMPAHGRAKGKAAERKARKAREAGEGGGRRGGGGGRSARDGGPDEPPGAAGAQAVDSEPAFPEREPLKHRTISAPVVSPGRRRRMPGPVRDKSEVPDVRINQRYVDARAREFKRHRGREPHAGERREMANDERRATAALGHIPSEFFDNQRQKEGDLAALELDRQKRGLGRGKRGDADYAPAAVRAKISKLRRLRKKHPAFRDREHDDAKGHFIRRRDDPDDKSKITSTHKEHPKWAGHYVDDSGKTVHGSGKKSNKKFSNATTFGNSDDDAMLHTDKSSEGSRASADDNEFVFHGDTDEDPRQKWYRVSKEGGYASAMASLGKSYHKSPDMRSKVISKVKSTGFTDSSGHQINVKPTGALHNERGACAKRPGGRLTTLGKQLKARDPGEFYRLCKGSHDTVDGVPVGGTKKGRSEYERGFDPRHDDSSKQHKLHKAAEGGKADKPGRNLAMHTAARPSRAADMRAAHRSIDRKAVRSRVGISRKSRR